MFHFIDSILRVVEKFLAPALFYLKGRSDVEQKELKEENEAIRRAIKIRNRINSDDAYLKRVRERFRR